MGTRADFYVGKGEAAEWLGSIAWDGYREGIPDAVLKATAEPEYRAAVGAFLAEREDTTLPVDGWPWPWESSGLTDCSYWFFDGQVWDEHDKHYLPCSEEPSYTEDHEAVTKGRELIDFPDMTAVQNVTLGRRSGLIVITPKGIIR